MYAEPVAAPAQQFPAIPRRYAGTLRASAPARSHGSLRSASTSIASEGAAASLARRFPAVLCSTFWATAATVAPAAATVAAAAAALTAGAGVDPSASAGTSTS